MHPALAGFIRPDRAKGEEDRQHQQRQVDQQHRPPADRGGQHAADGRPESACDRGDPAHRAERLAAILLTVGRAEDRHRGRQHQRTTDALHDPGRQQDVELRCQSGHGRCAGEQRTAHHEHPASAQQIRQPATQHQQAGQRQQTGVQHPLRTGGTDPERLHDVRQRQRNRRLVDQDHRVGQRHRNQHESPAIGGRWAGHRGSPVSSARRAPRIPEAIRTARLYGAACHPDQPSTAAPTTVPSGGRSSYCGYFARSATIASSLLFPSMTPADASARTHQSRSQLSS